VVFAARRLSRRLPGGRRRSIRRQAVAGAATRSARATAYLPEVGEYRRTHLPSLIASIRDKVVASGAMEEDELDHHVAAVSEHLADADTLVIDKLLIQCWGRRPAQSPP
jgi:hypothetical protein